MTSTNFRIAILILLLIICFLLDVLIGSITIPISETFKIILGIKSENQIWIYIIKKIRFPKALTALLAGSALSISGLQLQTIFRNPLAGPSMLGITAGASLGVALVMLALGNITHIAAIRQLDLKGSGLLIFASTIGSCIVLLLILLVAWRVKNHVVLLIIGIMIGNIILSIISVGQYFSSPEQIQNYLIWTFGSLGGTTAQHLNILTVIVVLGSLICLAISKHLNVLLIGENYAQSMGLSILKIRFTVILLTGLFTGAITAFCGPIGFVGIAVPHLARVIFSTADHKILIITCFLIGALFMLCCDIISRLLGNENILPINIVTPLFGSPVVIWIIMKKRFAYHI